MSSCIRPIVQTGSCIYADAVLEGSVGPARLPTRAGGSCGAPCGHYGGWS